MAVKPVENNGKEEEEVDEDGEARTPEGRLDVLDGILLLNEELIMFFVDTQWKLLWRESARESCSDFKISSFFSFLAFSSPSQLAISSLLFLSYYAQIQEEESFS